MLNLESAEKHLGYPESAELHVSSGSSYKNQTVYKKLRMCNDVNNQLFSNCVIQKIKLFHWSRVLVYRPY